MMSDPRLLPYLPQKQPPEPWHRDTKPGSASIYYEHFIVNSWPREPDGVSWGGALAAVVYPGYNVDGTNLEEAVTNILIHVRPGDKIKSIQFWGHASEGNMHVGNDRITEASFVKTNPLARLIPYLSPESRIYFRGCEVFRGDDGRRFAEKAAAFFHCRVAGHTQWIAKELYGGRIGIPTYPGYVELRPGEKAGWTDPPSNAPKTVKPKPKGKESS
jgi:hypothetical protein